jgi:uncharacterized membrane protein
VEAIGVRSARPAASNRLGFIDALRGLAIVTMVAANSGAEVLGQPRPFWFRLYGSFAAPIFVTLAGMMVALATGRDRLRAGPNRRGFAQYLSRGIFILLIAMIVDLGIEGYLPLMTCDVLYLIALSLPLCYVACRLGPPATWGAALAVFLLTPCLQAKLGYQLSMHQPALDTPLTEWPNLVPGAARRFLIDGWFPAFPWIGFALLGAALGARTEGGRKSPCLPPGLAIGTLAVGIAWWLRAPGAMVERAGYTELFYPPDIGYILTACGIVLCLLLLFERHSESRSIRWLRPLGRCSLLIYIVHLFVVQRAWRPLVDDMPLGQFLGLYVGFLALLWLLAVGVDSAKRICRETGVAIPAPLAVLLGA